MKFCNNITKTPICTARAEEKTETKNEIAAKWLNWFCRLMAGAQNWKNNKQQSSDSDYCAVSHLRQQQSRSNTAQLMRPLIKTFISFKMSISFSFIHLFICSAIFKRVSAEVCCFYLSFVTVINWGISCCLCSLQDYYYDWVEEPGKSMESALAIIWLCLSLNMEIFQNYYYYTLWYYVQIVS